MHTTYIYHLLDGVWAALDHDRYNRCPRGDRQLALQSGAEGDLGSKLADTAIIHLTG